MKAIKIFLITFLVNNILLTIVFTFFAYKYINNIGPRTGQLSIAAKPVVKMPIKKKVKIIFRDGTTRNFVED